YRNTDVAAKHLVRHTPGNMADGLDHQNNLWDLWSRLDEVVKRGHPALPERAQRVVNYKQRNRNFILAMHA
ncbi:MAG: hypothetical protein ABIH03_13040, partial [Pseudomonadota bacterium]